MPYKRNYLTKIADLGIILSQEKLPHTLIPDIASTCCGKYTVLFFLGHPVYCIILDGAQLRLPSLRSVCFVRRFLVLLPNFVVVIDHHKNFYEIIHFDNLI